MAGSTSGGGSFVNFVSNPGSSDALPCDGTLSSPSTVPDGRSSPPDGTSDPVSRVPGGGSPAKRSCGSCGLLIMLLTAAWRGCGGHHIEYPGLSAQNCADEPVSCSRSIRVDQVERLLRRIGECVAFDVGDGCADPVPVCGDDVTGRR